jgi:CBS domain-containing protein
MVGGVTVRDIMDPDPATVTPDTPVEDVVRLLRQNELPGLPVVNAGGRCVGIITERDLVIADEGGELHLPHFIELFGGIVMLPGSLQRFEEKLRKASASTAQDLMTEDPETIDPEASVSEAGRLISRTGHNRLPVVEHGRLVGVVTRVDVLDALTREE